MPKKKAITTEEVPSPQQTPAEYVNRSWGGLAHYECCSCTFDTFSHTEMLEHLVNNHNSEKALEELCSAESSANQSEEIEHAKTDFDEDHSTG